jgi:hypothetical protein
MICLALFDNGHPRNVFTNIISHSLVEKPNNKVKAFPEGASLQVSSAPFFYEPDLHFNLSIFSIPIKFVQQ